MSRKNRLSVPNGTYHITSRIVNKEHLLRDPALKDRIMDGLHGTAAFSGVQLLAWCIMDNHFHILVHVPEVPRDYWTDPEVSPAAYAFGMRPTECRVPLWSLPNPDGDGDSPHFPNPRVSACPKVGFMLSDDEMVKRLTALYGSAKRLWRGRTRKRQTSGEFRRDSDGSRGEILSTGGILVPSKSQVALE